MKHVKVLIGNYGSGKSELALNFAMQARARRPDGTCWTWIWSTPTSV